MFSHTSDIFSFILSWGSNNIIVNQVMIIFMIKAKRTCNKSLCSSLNAASMEISNDIKQYDHVAPEKKFREYCKYWWKEVKYKNGIKPTSWPTAA
jgi:hypothetical protein